VKENTETHGLNMRKALLDSDIPSEISKGFNKSVLQNASDYLNEHGRLTFTSISIYEVLYGIKAKPAPRQADRFLALLAGHEEIVPDADDYRGRQYSGRNAPCRH
jgi:tRNA(fMet)-specific endonuclease VapC